MRSGIWLLLFAVLLTGSGCLSRSYSVPPEALQALHGGMLQQAAVLRSVDGSKVRLDPNSLVRLRHRHGHTSFLRAASLRVSEDGVGVEVKQGKESTEHGVPWEMVQGVEIINPSGGKTAAMFVVTSAAMAAIASVVLVDLMVSGLTRGRGDGWVRVVGAIASGCATLAWGALWTEYEKRPEETSAHGLALVRSAPVAIRPLFATLPRRRAIIRGLVTLDAGSELWRWSGGNGGVSAGMRLWDMFELSGGARYLFTASPLELGGTAQASCTNASGVPCSATPPEPPSIYARSSFVGFFRFDLHLDLDARRRVALRLGVEAGAGGAVQQFTRLNWGLRVRVNDTFFLGTTLFSPTYVGFQEGSPLALASGWTFPSGVEAGWAF